jgi:hypothetical protein
MTPSNWKYGGKQVTVKRSLFISYRRSDTAGTAGRLRDALDSRVRRATFMDVSDIEVGEDFVARIKEVLDQSGVMLAVIGPKWLGKEDGKRLGDPGDYVTQELRLAIETGVPIIPVLVDGAVMPSPDDLPQDLAKIATLNAVELRHTSFDRDVEHLSLLVYEKLNVPPPIKVERWMQALHPYPLDWTRMWSAIVGFVVGLFGLGIALMEAFEPWPPLGSMEYVYYTFGMPGPEGFTGAIFAAALWPIGRRATRFSWLAHLGALAGLIGLGVAIYNLIVWYQTPLPPLPGSPQ